MWAKEIFKVFKTHNVNSNYCVVVIVYFHWVQSKRHRLWFSTKKCSCYSTKTHINSAILILKLNLTSLRNIYINMCVVLNEDHFYCICFSTKSNSIWRWGLCCLHEFSLSNNYTVFVENHNLWRFDCTQWFLWHQITNVNFVVTQCYLELEPTYARVNYTSQTCWKLPLLFN